MALLLHVEFDASSESVARKILELLGRMGNIVHRDHSEVYTYVFRHDNQTKSKLLFTELYANEQVFLDHVSDPEFSQLYRQAFTQTAGRSRKELCLRDNINNPLSPITANILDNYLHVTYISVQQGFFYRKLAEQPSEYLLIVCRGCDENVYEQLNTLVNCVTCVSFNEQDGNRQLIAVIARILNEKVVINDVKPSIHTIELVCSQEKMILKFKDMLDNYFQIQSLQIQTNFSGYIHH